MTQGTHGSAKAEAKPGSAAVMSISLYAELMQRRAAAACIFALGISILANAAAFHVIKGLYADVRTATVFPYRAQSAFEDGALPTQKTGTRIVLFGDSRIVQWRNFPAPAGAELVMRGVAGETTAQMRLRFASDVLALNPDIVVLQMGINDMVSIGALPDRQAEIAIQCANNIEFFVKTLQEKNIRTVLLTIIPPDRPALWRRPVWSNQISVEVDKLNRHWIEVPASPALHVVDTRSLLQDAQGRWQAGVTADTLHLTQRGYEYLNVAVAPLLRDRRDIPHVPVAPLKRGA